MYNYTTVCAFLQFSMAREKSVLDVFSSFSVTATWIVSMLEKRFPLSSIFSIGNRKQSGGLKSGEYGWGWGSQVLNPFFLAGNWVIPHGVCWSVVMQQEEGLIFPQSESNAYNSFTETNQNVFIEIGIVSTSRGHKFLIRNPLVDKKTINMVLILDFWYRNFFGRGVFSPTHRALCRFVLLFI